MSNQPEGLYRKFNVSRVDGRDREGGDRQGAEYFVLDLTHDPHARAALLGYAVSCRRDYPALSRDLLAQCKGIQEVGHIREERLSDPESEWQGFWRDIVAPGGVVDVEQVKAELSDYSMLLHFVPKVYDHVTGGYASTPNILPSVICALHDDHVTRLCEEACEEAREEEAEGRDDEELSDPSALAALADGLESIEGNENAEMAAAYLRRQAERIASKQG